MSRFWFCRGQAHEGLELLQRASSSGPSTDPTIDAQLQNGVAMLGIIAGRLDLTADASDLATALADSDPGSATHQHARALSGYPLFFIDADRSADRCSEVRRLGVNGGDPFAQSFASAMAGYSYLSRDRHQEALAWARPAYRRSLIRSERLCAALARGVEQYSKIFTGSLDDAVLMGREILSLVEPLANHYIRGTMVTNVALSLGMSGDLDGARSLMQPVVRAVNELPEVDAVAYMYTCGRLSLWEGEVVDAQEWLGARAQPARVVHLDCGAVSPADGNCASPPRSDR